MTTRPQLDLPERSSLDFALGLSKNSTAAHMNKQQAANAKTTVRSQDFDVLTPPTDPEPRFPELPDIQTRTSPDSGSPMTAVAEVEPQVAHAPLSAAQTEKSSRDESYALPAIGKSSLSSASRKKFRFEVGTCYSVLKERLYFAAHRDDTHTMQMIDADSKIFYFSSHVHESYMPFCADFGPINLSGVISFCEFVDEKMNDARLKKRPLVYYCSPEPELLTNLAFLMGCYLIICHGQEPEEVNFFTMFTEESSPFLPFRDATFSKSIFNLRLMDCLRGLQTARRIGWLKEEEFDQDEYDNLEDPVHADLHQVCDKFIAFKGPNDHPQDEFTFSPSHYVPILLSKDVKAVIRLNEASTYNPQPFVDAGIKHYDLYFDDCTVPPKDIVKKFLRICEEVDGAIAVHCLAGLGRTGTLIALWMMKHHGTKAAETIAWLRIARPGSVIGLQQVFLQKFDNFDWNKLEDSCCREGARSRDGESFRSCSPSGRTPTYVADSLLPEELAEQVKNGVRAKAADRSKAKK